MLRLITLALLLAPLAEAKPYWINSPAKGTFVGESHSETSKETALDNSYTDALIKAATKNFPELIEVRNFTEEGLKTQEHSRTFLVHLERVNFDGVEELEDPYVELIDGKFTIYRLIRWDHLKPLIKKEKVEIEPYYYAKTIGNPKVKTGDTKSTVLRTFGEPYEASDIYPLQVFRYQGKFCKDDETCSIYFKDGHVVSTADLKAKFTEILK